MTELLKQGRYNPMPVEEQVIVDLSQVTRASWTNLPLEDVVRFRNELLGYVRASKPDVIAAINTDEEAHRRDQGRFEARSSTSFKQSFATTA